MWGTKQWLLLRQTPALQGVQKQAPGHEMEWNGTDGRRFPRCEMNGAEPPWWKASITKITKIAKHDIRAWESRGRPFRKGIALQISTIYAIGCSPALARAPRTAEEAFRGCQGAAVFLAAMVLVEMMTWLQCTVIDTIPTDGSPLELYQLQIYQCISHVPRQSWQHL